MSRSYEVWLILLFLNGVFGFANTQPAHVEVSGSLTAAVSAAL